MHEVEGFRDAEDGELHVALVGDHDVLWDDVELPAVATAFFMGVGEAAGDPGDEEGGEIHRHGASHGLVPLQELLEIYAADKLHHREILAVGLPEMVGLDDVGVDQIRHQPGLADEVILDFINGRAFLAYDYYGHDLAEIARAELLGLVNQPHAALGNLAHHLVVDFGEYLVGGSHGRS